MELGDGVAHFCMTTIGIGYLFPISAVWSAYDYWTLLFPDMNFEFGVTQVYQLGSLLTVAALSAGSDFNMSRRIYSGFIGQFVSLFAIFCIRWAPESLNGTSLYIVLLAIIFLCSIATGFLDSALLALCSQYSPEMQGKLQLGIGFGTLVSLLYRDASKATLSHDIRDATSAFFICALMTVLLCIWSYRRLMQLPVSRHISPAVHAEKAQPLVPARQTSGSSIPPNSMNRSISTPQAWSPNQPLADAQDIDDEEVTEVDPRYTELRRVLAKVWVNQLAVFCNLALTTTCYPGLITSIPCRNFNSLRASAWFQTLLLTVFTVSDVVARFFTQHRLGIKHDNIMRTVVVRAAVVPLMLFCIKCSWSHDLISVAVVSAFGALNGWCVSLALIVVNEVPRLSFVQRATAGRLSALAANGGLFVGAIIAGALDWAFALSAEDQ